jgi:phage replication-related protein YjqB (UPF0714/DUF867 family)
LSEFLDHVQTAIAIHGHGRGQDFVYVGGLHQTMAQRFIEIARPALPEYQWVCDPEDIPSGLRGLDPKNIVNLPPNQGMQLELPKALRQTRPSSTGGHLEPDGDARVLSRLLIGFVDRMMVDGA